MVIEFAARDIDMIVGGNYNIAGLRDKSRPAFVNRFFRFSPTCRGQKGKTACLSTLFGVCATETRGPRKGSASGMCGWGFGPLFTLTFWVKHPILAMKSRPGGGFLICSHNTNPPVPSFRRLQA